MTQGCVDSMNDHRKKIILNEIHYWKQNRMLPDTYCDYLLALYSEGEESLQMKNHDLTPKRSYLLPALFLIFIFVSALIVNYFTEINPLMQMSLYIFLISLILGIIYYRKVSDLTLLFSLVGLALVVLLLTVRVWEVFFPNKDLILYLILLMNSTGWFVIGQKINAQYFKVSSVLGGIVIFYFIMLHFGIL